MSTTIIPRELIEGANNNSFFDRGIGLERDAQNECASFETCDELNFDGKPDEETCARLKACGFRWSPRFGAWQRQNTPNGLAVARQFFNDYKAA